MENHIEIFPFQAHYQRDIDEFMAKIELEFSDSIFSPQSKTMTEVSSLPSDTYWVAISNDKVVGTIGLSKLQNGNIVLKRLFLNADFRGQGVSKKLLATLLDFAMANRVSNIYLGTMTQFKAAQRFYEKHEFKEIPQNELPIDFPINPVDKIFYKLELKTFGKRQQVDQVS